MILGIDPIPLSRLGRAISVLAELDAIVDMHADVDIFADPYASQLIADATRAFRSFVDDNCEHEGEVRRALAYVLNLDDEALVAVTSPMHIRMRARASDGGRSATADRRRPWWGHTAENALNWPATGWVTTTLRPWRMTPPPTGTSAFAAVAASEATEEATAPGVEELDEPHAAVTAAAAATTPVVAST